MKKWHETSLDVDQYPSAKTLEIRTLHLKDITTLKCKQPRFIVEVIPKAQLSQLGLCQADVSQGCLNRYSTQLHDYRKIQ